jgi:hypothetical protein
VEGGRLALPVMVGLIVGKGIVEAILMSAAIQFNLSLLFKLSIFLTVSWFLTVERLLKRAVRPMFPRLHHSRLR